MRLAAAALPGPSAAARRIGVRPGATAIRKQRGGRLSAEKASDKAIALSLPLLAEELMPHDTKQVCEGLSRGSEGRVQSRAPLTRKQMGLPTMADIVPPDRGAGWEKFPSGPLLDFAWWQRFRLRPGMAILAEFGRADSATGQFESIEQSM